MTDIRPTPLFDNTIGMIKELLHDRSFLRHVLIGPAFIIIVGVAYTLSLALNFHPAWILLMGWFGFFTYFFKVFYFLSKRTIFTMRNLELAGKLPHEIMEFFKFSWNINMTGMAAMFVSYTTILTGFEIGKEDFKSLGLDTIGVFEWIKTLCYHEPIGAVALLCFVLLFVFMKVKVLLETKGDYQ